MITLKILRSLEARDGASRYVALVLGLTVACALPWLVYPPVALDIAAWSLFAIAFDLLLGFTGLLSFGHAAFWGTSAYSTGLIAIHFGAPFPVAILGGAIVAAILAVPIGWLSVRRGGVYFAMVTLAFAQMIYFVVNQWEGATGGENGLQGIPRTLGGVDLSGSFVYYYAALPVVLLGVWMAWRTVNSPFGTVIVAIRDNPARSTALGYNVLRYKLVSFVISAFLSGLAGGIFATNHGLVSLQDVYWTTSGKVVIITVLGGIGTLWGAMFGAGIIVMLDDYLATAGIQATLVVTGTIFVVVVLLFRQGVWGTLSLLIRRAAHRRQER